MFKDDLIIFLDYDGVLNNGNEYFGRGEYFRFNNVNVVAFEKLLSKLETKYRSVFIVLNTAWKIGNPNRVLYETKLISPIKEYRDIIIGCTETFDFYDEDYCCKSFEVEHYIVKNNLSLEDTDALILDDEVIESRLGRVHIYRTDSMLGLTEGDIPKILKSISNKNKSYNE